MFKKLKDKLAEEVKSSPQRIQQFAQAAQAAVTSASSSISDITNNDLFSIGDNENPQSRSIRTPTPSTRPVEPNVFQDVTLQSGAMQASTEEMDFSPRHDSSESHNQRRLSTSSFASDVSFRLPSYESPSLYHLQSDMEVSASEAEERGFSSGAASLDRVTKDQLYAAYKRTQQRYQKYRTQYADLARHYKFLERDNAKARSVLVETQDKALRRISELREQCTLEQSAKAHLEKALRLEIDEKSMKIEALNSKLSCLQDTTINEDTKNEEVAIKEPVKELQLIDFSGNNERKVSGDEGVDTALTNKAEKLEQLVNKYKESLKVSKEKNSQLTTELHILSNQLENKNKENEQLKNSTMHLTEARKKILELQEINEEIQNKLNTYEFNQMKEKSSLELDLQKALEEIEQLRSKIEVFNKREEEYAISLAENKLSIHKELESKEAEIKSLKDNLNASKNEIQSLNIVVNDYKKSVSLLEDEKFKLNNNINELNSVKAKLTEKESQIKDLTQKCKLLEQGKTKADEEYKCLQLQVKQETAEKLAMMDRNAYLETKNTQLTEENLKKSSQVNELETQLNFMRKDNEERENQTDQSKIIEELESWRNKYYTMELEIQDEREELVKLQSEIEKLLQNYEVSQTQNLQLVDSVSDLTAKNANLKDNNNRISKNCQGLITNIKNLRNMVYELSNETILMKENNVQMVSQLKEKLLELTVTSNTDEIESLKAANEKLKRDYDAAQNEVVKINEHLTLTSKEIITCQESNKQLKEQIESLISDKTDIKEELKKVENDYHYIQIELCNLKREKSDLLHKVNELEVVREALESTISLEREENLPFHNKLTTLENDNQTLLQKLEHIETQNNGLRALMPEVDALKLQYEVLLVKKIESDKKKVYLEDEIKALSHENISLKNQSQNIELCNLKRENSDLLHKVHELEVVRDAFESTLNFEREENLPFQNKLTTLENDNQTLLQKLEHIETQNNNLRALVPEVDALKLQYEVLLAKNIEFDEKKVYYEKLEDEVKALSHENISLKNQSQNIATNLKALEAEISDVRKSHADMESEKDHLNAIIKKLEETENAKQALSTVDVQTDENSFTLELVIEENKVLKDKCEQFKQEKETLYERTISIDHEKDILVAEIEKQNSYTKKIEEENKNLIELNSELSTKVQDLEKIRNDINDKTKHDDELEDKISLMKKQYDLVKDDNKRLTSDIEGLQTHIAKISKENSMLNDKLREMIASSEHVDKAEDSSRDFTELQNGNKANTDKMNDLVRENMLLVEENLELKDQLRSQNYVQSPNNNTNNFENGSEMEILKEKYNTLLTTNNKYEKQLSDLEHINRSMNGNMQNVQETNEKLRLSNEKLERRLDEALVSLRHLHSLQENTELEYLRNVLYEYLTGSGTHSVTLAKVLAAVVKFDEMQTNIVLQKEKERQGLLRQLGLL